VCDDHRPRRTSKGCMTLTASQITAARELLATQEGK
jgi:hypothetical protein